MVDVENFDAIEVMAKGVMRFYKFLQLMLLLVIFIIISIYVVLCDSFFCWFCLLIVFFVSL